MHTVSTRNQKKLMDTYPSEYRKTVRQNSYCNEADRSPNIHRHRQDIAHKRVVSDTLQNRR